MTVQVRDRDKVMETLQAPASLRGRYSGFAGAAWGAGYLLAPLGGTPLLVLGAPVRGQVRRSQCRPGCPGTRDPAPRPPGTRTRGPNGLSASLMALLTFPRCGG